MFDFLTKLFSSSSSQPDKALEVTEKNTLNAKSPSALSVSAKAELEQQRQAWRQKVDAAAHSEEVLLDLLFACDHADGRLYAAQYLQGRSALETVRARFKKNDQRLMKYVQGRLEQLKQKEALGKAIDDCISHGQLLLQASVILPNQLAQLDHMRTKLDTLGELAPEAQQKFDEMRRALDKRMDAQVALQRQLLSIVSRLQQGIGNESTIDRPTYEKLFAEFSEVRGSACAASLPRHPLTEAKRLLETYAQHLTVLENRILESSKILGSSDEMIDVLHVSGINALELHVDSGDQELQGTAAQDKTVDNAAIHADQRDINLDQADFNAALEGLEQALSEGRTQQAREFEKVLAVVDLQHAPAYVSKKQMQRLAAARKEFARLMSWARWSGVASREELVATAEGLAQLSLQPKELVDTVTALRSQWKQIEGAGGAGSRELWLRFDAACSAAYAPAASHFQEQSQLRKANAEQARALLTEFVSLAQDLMTETPDWRLVANSLSQMRQKWRAIGAMDRKEKEVLTGEFEACLQDLEQALQAQREVAEANRLELISVAKAIDASVRDAVEQVRKLQAQWQQNATAVPLERKREQELWTLFRAACDQIFEARKNQHREFEQERIKQLDAKHELCLEIERLVESKEADVRVLSEKMATFDKQWRSLGAVPRESEKQIEARYKTAIGVLQSQISQLEMQRYQQQANQMSQFLQACFDVENAVFNSDSSQPNSGNLIDECIAQFNATKDVHSKALRQRALALQKMRAQTSAVSNALSSETNLKDLVLKLELALELPSPVEEQARRREIQLSMLQQSLRQGRDAQSDQVMYEQLLATPCALSQQLQNRIHAILKVGLSRWPLKK
ncbi:DUF349 domain-containing protein [Undibacterium cyanobacteriorum]|uniref:DUF349 domain-containing protein n=1 Tax=Undibacterium cyanobacteriorum TaxID=3073561 RepID=A0ABY9RM86_9BURK|nr:DUF349 domain-containing protein [Undibacterium sp. 20NA77.5]WMW81988.1 DUF349 domain-containing protein [Undibacterium sp. 20NA77.5]